MPCTIHERLWDITTEATGHLVRVGGCPIFSVKVSYPQFLPITPPSTLAETAIPPAVARFNDTYRAAAEAFAAWALEAPAREASLAFEAMGQGAAYRFARWELSCDMVPSWEENEQILRVTTTAMWRVRREPEARRTVSAEALWQVPALWRVIPPRHASEKHRRKIPKSIRKVLKKTGNHDII